MKLNRKGYLTVEIILASAVAFAIAFFLMEITVKLVSKTDDVYHETVITYDDAIMINNIKDKIIDYIICIIGRYIHSRSYLNIINDTDRPHKSPY